MRCARALRASVAASLAAVALASALIASPARAVEHEHRFGLDAGGSMLDVADKGKVSICCGLGVHYVYGLTDQFNLLAEGTASVVSFGEDQNGKTPHTRPTMVSDVIAGVAYTLDIATLVPYGGILIGGYVMNGGTLDNPLVLPGGAIKLGLDYRLSHKWTVGFAVEQHMFVVKTSTYPSFSQALLSVDYAWGW